MSDHAKLSRDPVPGELEAMRELRAGETRRGFSWEARLQALEQALAGAAPPEEFTREIRLDGEDYIVGAADEARIGLACFLALNRVETPVTLEAGKILTVTPLNAGAIAIALTGVS